ncbi:hypothetical protein KC353_g60 [Hortaea werneckii]|nr:hypothetical protein KC353_g60 [Hortaea werneckii]
MRTTRGSEGCPDHGLISSYDSTLIRARTICRGHDEVHFLRRLHPPLSVDDVAWERRELLLIKVSRVNPYIAFASRLGCQRMSLITMSTDHEMVKLVSSDGVEIWCRKEITLYSQVMRDALDDWGTKDAEIPLKIAHRFQMLMRVCLSKFSRGLSAVWKTRKVLDMQEIVDIRNAADYLIIDELDELCCRYLAEGIADKTAEELCDLLKSDIPFATEEREEIDSELRNEIQCLFIAHLAFISDTSPTISSWNDKEPNWTQRPPNVPRPIMKHCLTPHPNGNVAKQPPSRTVTTSRPECVARVSSGKRKLHAVGDDSGEDAMIPSHKRTKAI